MMSDSIFYKAVRMSLVMDTEEKIKLIVGAIIIVSALGAFFGWSDKIISTVTEWGVSLIAGTLISAAAGYVVESFTGNILKTIVLPVPIGPFRFSVTAFAIATLFVRFVLFR